MDYFPPEKRERLHPVGRLDKDTTGLLLVTNDGQLLYHLTNPKFHVKKAYRFIVIGDLTHEKIAQLEAKIPLQGNGKATAGCEVTDITYGTVSKIADVLPPNLRARYLKNPHGVVTDGVITVTEGMHHEIKLMMRAVNCRVVLLERIMHGGVTLDQTLAPGSYRALTEAELVLLHHAY